MKGILSKEQIEFILNESQKPIYSLRGIISFAVATENPFSIMKITEKGLIFINGTDDTGFTHINIRHTGGRSTHFWKDFSDLNGNKIEKKDSLGRKKYQLDNPSLFHPHSIPIFDYLLIAEQIYSISNLNNEKNKQPDLFDLYEGKATANKNNEQFYRLLLYKDTKIVHTLYPIKKTFNKQKKIIVDFARLSPRTITTLNKIEDFQVEIPYIDEYNVIRYLVIIRVDPMDNLKEKLYIQVYSPLGQPLFTHYYGSGNKHCEINSPEFLNFIERMDFTDIEKIIKKIENLLKPSNS